MKMAYTLMFFLVGFSPVIIFAIWGIPFLEKLANQDRVKSDKEQKELWVKFPVSTPKFSRGTIPLARQDRSVR